MEIDHRWWSIIGAKKHHEADRIKWGWLNVGGIKGSLEETTQLMNEHQIVDYMKVGVGLLQGSAKDDSSEIFKLCGQEIKQVERFKYLGL